MKHHRFIEICVNGMLKKQIHLICLPIQSAQYQYVYVNNKKPKDALTSENLVAQKQK